MRKSGTAGDQPNGTLFPKRKRISVGRVQAGLVHAPTNSKRRCGASWVEKFAGSKGLRDSIHDINIHVLLTGDYPGDGLVKPVCFPEPDVAAELDDEGIPILTLPHLLQLKLASGMTAPHRPRDLDDVIQLIRANQLPRDYAEQLHPYVRTKFVELWDAAQYHDEY